MGKLRRHRAIPNLMALVPQYHTPLDVDSLEFVQMTLLPYNVNFQLHVGHGTTKYEVVRDIAEFLQMMSMPFDGSILRRLFSSLDVDLLRKNKRGKIVLI